MRRTEALNIFKIVCELLEGLHYVAFFLTAPNSKGFFLGFFWGGGWAESHSIVQTSWYSHTGFALTAIPSQFLKCRDYRIKSARNQKEFCRNRNYTFVYSEINSTEDSTS